MKILEAEYETKTFIGSDSNFDDLIVCNRSNCVPFFRSPTSPASYRCRCRHLHRRRERGILGLFDVQDARLGGLIRRVKHCRDRLLAYVRGESESIPELEEEILNPFGLEKPEGIAYNYYNALYTVNPT